MHTSGPGRPHYGATRRRGGSGSVGFGSNGSVGGGVLEACPARGGPAPPPALARRRQRRVRAADRPGRGRDLLRRRLLAAGHDPGALLLADQPGVAVLVGLRPGHGAVGSPAGAETAAVAGVAGAAADRPPRRRTRRRPRRPRRRRPPRPRRTPPRPDGIGAASERHHPSTYSSTNAFLKTPPRVELGGQAAGVRQAGVQTAHGRGGHREHLAPVRPRPEGRQRGLDRPHGRERGRHVLDPGEVDRDASPARTPG